MNNKLKNAIIILIISLLFTAGIFLVSYPAVSNWLSKRNHSRLIQSYSTTVEQLEQMDIDEQLNRASEYNGSLSGKNITDPFIPDSGYVVPKNYFTILNIDGIMGYIEIPAINVYLPIYHGVSENALQKGVGHMNETAFPIGGEGCHAVLTGHRGLPSSELFSNLVKLTEGEKFYIHILDRVFAYSTIFTKTILPGETNYLRPVPGEDYVTLITCTPYSINSHRFIVTGKRIEYTPAKDADEPDLTNGSFNAHLLDIGLIILILLLSLLVYIINKSISRNRNTQPLTRI